MKRRVATVARKTKETDIRVRLDLDGQGRCRVETGLPFLNHMLQLLARHSLADLDVRARGDLEVDFHHTVEDVGLCLGRALNEALGDRTGIVRYGAARIPMDEALAEAALDLGGRPYLVFAMSNRRRTIGDFPAILTREFFRAFATESRMNLHIAQPYGDEPHHAHEAVFKAVARALRQACARDPRVRGVPSSKGVL